MVDSVDAGVSVDAGAGAGAGAAALQRVVVVLVRSHSAGNVGSVARLCGNYGCKLRLVAPQCSPVSKEARMFAAGDLRPLDEMQIFADLTAALADIDVSVGTSSKLQTAKETPVLDVVSAARCLPGKDERVAFVFGNERDGLSIDEGALCDRVVRLHTPGYHDSLNLSHAVGAVLALLTAATSTSVTPPPLSTRARERLIDDWNTQLSDRGYFKSTTAALFRPRLARLVDAMQLDDRDAALLQGMLRALSSAPSAPTPATTSSSDAEPV